MTSFYSQQELKKIGFKKVGTNVLLSRKASIYQAQNMEIGSNTRIDDFCILSGNIKIGDYVHIAAYCGLYAGTAGIEIKAFTNCSSRTMIYAKCDDFSGENLFGPMIPEQYKYVYEAGVTIEEYVLVGTGVTILPGIVIGEGVAIGGMSLVKKSLSPWWIYAGVPCQKIKKRKKTLLEKKDRFLREQGTQSTQSNMDRLDDL